MNKSIVPLNWDILCNIAIYAPEQVFLNLIRLTKQTIRCVDDKFFWLHVLRQRGFVIYDETTLSEKQLAKLFFRINDQFAYSLHYGGVVVFEEAVLSFLVGSHYVWLLAGGGVLYSASIPINEGKDAPRWVATILNEKVRKIRGILEDSSVLAVGDDSLFLAEPLGGAVNVLGDSDDLDYYIEDETIMGVQSTEDIIGVTILRAEDENSEFITPTVLLQPIETLINRLEKKQLHRASRSGKWQLSGRGESITQPIDVMVGDPTQTREEITFIYPEPGYDAEFVKDAVSEYDNSEYFGEGDAL